jgi:hypothetical protein
MHHSLTCTPGHSMLPAPMRNLRSPVKICGDRLMFTQSDMHLSKFGVDENGKTVLMDFGNIGLLPETFVAYTMSTDALAPIATSLGLSSDSGASMAAIAWYLCMTSDPTLGASPVFDMGFQPTFVIGLNEQGYPRTRARKHETKRIGYDAFTLSISKLSIVSKPFCLL